MSAKTTALRGVLAAITVTFALRAGTASAQSIRVLLIRSPDAKAVPPDAWQTFRQAVLEVAPGVTLVPSAAYATDLVELTRYGWDPGHALGVTQRWQFCHRTLVARGEPGEIRATASYVLTVPGKTLTQSSDASAKRLRRTLRQLILGVEPVASNSE